MPHIDSNEFLYFYLFIYSNHLTYKYKNNKTKSPIQTLHFTYGCGMIHLYSNYWSAESNRGGKPLTPTSRIDRNYLF